MEKLNIKAEFRDSIVRDREYYTHFQNYGDDIEMAEGVFILAEIIKTVREKYTPETARFN
ncbi:hypothetical protein J4477_01415 [Candidatus Pacearchaeota archaeon]|nr:hypothetical protein [Candidatus Pacearchaeota archaeon]